ncbi:MAG: glutathione synthase [Gammaproteobacteria bacterium]
MKLGIVMDPIQRINIQKDSSFAMLLAAQARDWDIYYMEQHDLYMQQDRAFARMQRLQVKDDAKNWFALQQAGIEELATLDVILMRKDPPFNMNYIYTTYMLEQAQKAGVLVINNPQALRNVNEKFYITHFPQCIAPTIVTSDIQILSEFVTHHDSTIVKPLDGMAGQGIFRLSANDPNKMALLESTTRLGTQHVMAQKYIAEITEGDKRILLVDGEPIPYALARIPARGEFRGNLARGGSGKGVELSERDRWICEQVGSKLKDLGLYFVGLDVIGDYLTEINVTSPTCIRELDSLYNISIGAQLMDVIERYKQGN